MSNCLMCPHSSVAKLTDPSCDAVSICLNGKNCPALKVVNSRDGRTGMTYAALVRFPLEKGEFHAEAAHPERVDKVDGRRATLG